jgi:plastocyanin
MSRPLLAGLALTLALAACTDYSSLASYQIPGAVTVHIVGSPETVDVYQPQVVRVRPGQRVVWVNATGDYDTVTFISATIPSSGGIPPGGTFAAVFRHPGTYRYYSSYNSGEVGAVVVEGR